MGHGPIRLLGSVIEDLFPGDVIYLLNSQEPLVVVLVLEDSVITNTAEVILPHRPIRTLFEHEKEFSFNWDGYVESDEFEIDVSGFFVNPFIPGSIVILLSEDRSRAKVETLVSKNDKSECYETDEGIKIPFLWNDRIIPTGEFQDIDR